MTAPAPPAVALPPFFASAFAWNLALGMTHILIPLYAYHLGFSGVAIGSLVSLPVLVQIGFNLLGGAWTDRLGGKRLAIVLVGDVRRSAGVVFAFASTFAALFARAALHHRVALDVLAGDLVARLPASGRPQRAGSGRLNSITNGGQIVGTIVAGLTIAWFGFAAGFWTVLALIGGAVAFALMAAFVAPAPPAADRTPSRSSPPTARSRAGARSGSRSRARTSRRCRSRSACRSIRCSSSARASRATPPAGCSRCARSDRSPRGSGRRTFVRRGRSARSRSRRRSRSASTCSARRRSTMPVPVSALLLLVGLRLGRDDALLPAPDQRSLDDRDARLDARARRPRLGALASTRRRCSWARSRTRSESRPRST